MMNMLTWFLLGVLSFLLLHLFILVLSVINIILNDRTMGRRRQIEHDDRHEGES